MPVEVFLPKVDMDMESAVLLAWHVAPGAPVTAGEPLFEIETAKAAMEVEAPATGTLHHVSASPGDQISVGTVIGWIYGEGEEVGPPPEPPSTATAAAATTPPPAESAEISPPQPVPQSGASPTTAPDVVPAEGARPLIRATPAARVAAHAAGIDLAQITGSGPRGRVQARDIAAHDTAAPPTGWTPQPGPLHVATRPGDGVPLVMLHGLAADSGGWLPLIRALGPHCPLIRIDLPGHGLSPRRQVADFAALARMLTAAFDDATRRHEQVHLLGHSLGGALALALADIRAPRLASLTLLAPAGLGPEVNAAALNGIIRANQAASLGPWLRRLVARPELFDDAYATAAMAARHDPQLRAVQAAMVENLFPDATQTFDLRPALARLALPTTIIWGRDDAILPPHHGLQAGGEIALHRLAATGHLPHVERPELVARIILRHLAGAEAAG